MCKRRVCLIDYPSYEICECGDIFKVKGNPGKNTGHGKISQHIGNKEGHMKVHLRDANKKRHHLWVHRVICTAFHGSPPVYGNKEALVRHLDDDPSNNSADNLRWGTRSDNERDKWRNHTY